MLSRRAGIWLFLAVAVALGIAALLFPQMDLPPSYTRNSDLLTVAGLYMIAKVCEVADKEIFSLGHAVSGHTLKHLASGPAGFWILRMLQKSQPIEDHGIR